MKLVRECAQHVEVSEVDASTARTQVAALCWRIADGKPQILLVTSRETGRWVLPKGWPQAGRSGPESARAEAWEEAGVEGRIAAEPVGHYAYHKVLAPEADVPCVVAVYPLRVKSLARNYPERAQRKRRWFAPKKAAQKVDEPALKLILRAFVPGGPAA